MNTHLEYVYRDARNFKWFGDVETSGVGKCGGYILMKVEIWVSIL
jgi:hypothetical protein